MRLERVFEWSIAFIFGVFLVAFCGFGLFFCVVMVVCCCFFMVMLVKKVLSFKQAIWLIFMLFFGSLCFFVHNFCFRDRAFKFAGENLNVCARVIEVNYFCGDRKAYVFEVSKINDSNLIVPLRVDVSGEKKFEFEDCSEVTAKMNLFAKKENCSKFGFSSRRAKNIHLNGKITNIYKIEQGNGLFAGFSAVRERLLKNINFAMDEPANFLASSIFLGKQQQIPYKLRRNFNHCGLSHVFAVSGLHISMMCAILLSCLRFLRIQNKFLLFILFVFLFCYNILVGFCPSAVRASLMNFAYIFGTLFKKKFNSVHLMTVCAAIILFFVPNAAYGCGFWLSFSSNLGILLFSRPISVMLRRRLFLFADWQRFFVDLFATSVSALVFSSIFLVMFFGELSIVAPFVNLIVMPFIPIVFVLSGLIATFGGVPGFDLLTNFCGQFCEGIFFEIVCVVKFFSSLPFAHLPMRYFFVSLVVAGLVGFLSFVFFYAKHIFFSKLVAALCSAIVFVPTLNNFLVSSGASIISVVGNGCVGHSVVISSSNKVVVLTCGGPVGCEQNLCKFLDSRGIKKIDFLISLSARSAGGNFDVETVVSCFKTFCVMMPYQFKSEHLIKFLAQNKSCLVFLDQSNYLNFPVSIDFLKSRAGQGFSCLLKIGGLSFVYCFSQQELFRIQQMVGYVNLVFLNNPLVDFGELDDSQCGYLILLNETDQNFKSSRIGSVDLKGVTEFVVHGNYLKKENV